MIKHIKILAILLSCSVATAHGPEELEKSDSDKNAISSKFEAPVELLADGKSIEGVGYPSPNLYDLDGDGQRELVVGDIMGNVFYSRKTSEGSLNQWSKSEKVEAEGKPLKLKNW